MHKADIVSLAADALVCPVDQNLNLTAGLARVISKAAGKEMSGERPLTLEPFGKVVVLPAGNLKVKYIFLTVILGESDLEKFRLIIRQAVDRAIRYAEFLRLKSIAFPVLGSPQMAPPYDFVAREMLEDITQYLKRRRTKLKAILFSAYNQQAWNALRSEAKDLADI